MLWGNHGIFDAIVGDPPYGVRAGARKSGYKPKPEEAERNPVDLTNFPLHIPPTQAYSGEEVMRDLIDAARDLLVDGGRLVFLMPIVTVDWKARKEACLPAHEGFTLINCAEQEMREGLSRILVTMERKTKDASSSSSSLGAMNLTQEQQSGLVDTKREKMDR